MNLIQISEQFPTDLEASAYFESFRWPDGIACPYCASATISERREDFRYYCHDCRSNFSVTVNTNLHGTRISLKTWLMTFAIVSDAKKGLSALQLQRNTGLHYETAWTMYHKIRELMEIENSSIPDLEGVLEMDEYYSGGKPRKWVTGKTVPPEEPIKKTDLDKRIKELKKEGFSFKRKRGNPAPEAVYPKRGRGADKTPVVGIVERGGNVVAKVMSTLTYADLMKLVKKHTDEADSVLVTDEYTGYARMHSIIEHIVINHKELYSYKGVNDNEIESFWATVERQIMGSHHWVSVKWLPYYVAELVFKWNNRHIDDMFVTLVKNSMKEKSVKPEAVQPTPNARHIKRYEEPITEQPPPFKEKKPAKQNKAPSKTKPAEKKKLVKNSKPVKKEKRK